jgi:hypothetical protein
MSRAGVLLNLIEGFSNYKNVLNVILSRAIKEFPKWSKQGKRRFGFKVPLVHDVGSKVSITINFRESDDGSFTKMTGNGNHLIVIDISYMDLNNKDDQDMLLGTLAHEVTHISQSYNGFKEYDFGSDFKQYNVSKGRLKKFGVTKYSQYYSKVSHSTRKTEKEAVLIKLFQLLKLKNMRMATQHTLGNSEYFSLYSYKQILTKAVVFGIGKEILKFRKVLVDEFKGSFDNHKSQFIVNERGFADWFEDFFVCNTDVIRSFKINIKPLLKDIVVEFDKLPKVDLSINWDVIAGKIKVLEKSK